MDLNEQMSSAIDAANDADVLTWGLPEFCSYRSGDPAYDYDLSGACLAAMKDVSRLVGEGESWPDAMQMVQSRLDTFHEACRSHAEREA